MGRARPKAGAMQRHEMRPPGKDPKGEGWETTRRLLLVIAALTGALILVLYKFPWP